MEQNIYKKRIMRRVYAVYILRKIFNQFTAKGAVFTLALFGFASLVHVAAVFDNMPSLLDTTSFFNFSYAAFVNTEFAVQALILALGVVALWLIKDAVGKLPKVNISFSQA